MSDTNIVLHNESDLPVLLDRGHQALVAASNDFERVRVRDGAKAVQAAAEVLKRKDIQVVASLLVCDAERAIAKANPPPTPSESGARKGQKGVVPDNTLPQQTIRDIRHAHNKVTDEQYQAAKDKAVSDEQPISRASIKNTGMKLRRQAAAKRHRERESRPRSSTVSLNHTAIADWNLSASSVDYVITDPPHEKAALSVWPELSKFAAHVLKPDGLLVALMGNLYLPEVITALGYHLTYRWQFAYVMPGANAKHFGRQIVQQWKPLLVYSKSEVKREFVGDMILVPSISHQENDLHKWQQQEAGWQMVVDKFAAPGDVVCDPFLGSGTTGVCALARGCWFLGADIDADCVDTARERIGAET